MSVFVELTDDVPSKKIVSALVKKLELSTAEKYFLVHNSIPIGNGISLADARVSDGDIPQLERII